MAATSSSVGRLHRVAPLTGHLFLGLGFEALSFNIVIRVVVLVSR
jgi:hypothetical protein